MALTDKEIAHFQSELPKGMAVVDFREIKDRKYFVEKYCTKGMGEFPYSVRSVKALENFIKQIRK